MTCRSIVILAGYLIYVSAANSQQPKVSDSSNAQGESIPTNNANPTNRVSISTAEMVAIKKVILDDLGITSRSKVLGESGYNIVGVASNEVPLFANLYENQMLPKIKVCGDKESIQALVDEKGIDRKTGAQCQIFSVSLTASRSTGADLKASKYYGPMAAEFYDYSLTNHNGQWSIASKRLSGAF